MAESSGKARYAKSLASPDDTTRHDQLVQCLVELGDVAIARTVHEPGWRWRTHIQPIVGGEWCQARHVGVVLQGRLAIELADGTGFVLEPDDAFDIPPGHDGYVLGDEALTILEWSAAVRTWMGASAGTQQRVLATLLFTDLVDSTAIATRLGDAAWHVLLAGHYEMARHAFERFRGHEVKTTGDGLLATFDGPAAALACAAAIRDAAIEEGLHVRVGIHVGEVHAVGKDVRGAAVHAAARVMSKAAADEILVSETTRTLSVASGLAFEDRGAHELKGLPGTWQLYAYAG
ncbi:MAG: adenylate/guanylate cyclase domain-containing protein [Actinomycetota bacterium]